MKVAIFMTVTIDHRHLIPFGRLKDGFFNDNLLDQTQVELMVKLVATELRVDKNLRLSSPFDRNSEKLVCFTSYLRMCHSIKDAMEGLEGNVK